MVVTEGYSQSGVKYPYIQGGDGASNIIVSRDAAGGVDPACIHPNWTGATPAHNEQSTTYNLVPAKLEVASSNVSEEKYDWETANSICPTGWRLPTQRELLLIYVMQDRLQTSNLHDSFGRWDSGYWSSTGYSHVDYPNQACKVYMFVDETGEPLSYTMSFENKTTKYNVRCVRDVN